MGCGSSKPSSDPKSSVANIADSKNVKGGKKFDVDYKRGKTVSCLWWGFVFGSARALDRLDLRVILCRSGIESCENQKFQVP